MQFLSYEFVGQKCPELQEVWLEIAEPDISGRVNGQESQRNLKRGVPCRHSNSTNNHFFEPMSKRRKEFASESQVKRGIRFVHGDKLLEEKLGRNDLCHVGQIDASSGAV